LAYRFSVDRIPSGVETDEKDFEPAPDAARPRGGNGRTAPKSGVTHRPLLYRYGFVALARDQHPEQAHDVPARLGWRRRRIGPITLWSHPEATVRIVALEETRFVFIGDVIPETDPAEGDPFAPHRLAAVIAGGDTDLYDFLDTFAGRFALLVVERDRTRVFHDPMGARSVFYRSGGPLAVASHARLLADCVGARHDPVLRELRTHRGFASRKTKSLPGDLTLALGIYALVPNNLFDSATARTARYWPRGVNPAGQVEEFHGRLDRSLGALARHVSERGAPVIGATAGADSRVAIAAFLRNGVPFETATWRLADLSESERDIIADLVRLTGAPHVETPSDAETRTRGIAQANSGGYRHVYRGTFEMRAAYSGRPGTIFVRGHGAEVMRGFFNLWPTRMTALTPPEMARLYYSPTGAPLPAGLLEMFEGYFERANYAGVADLGFDPNDIYYWEHRMGMWSSAVSNEFDVAMPSLPAFNSRPLFASALALPPGIRLTKRLLLAATDRLDPRFHGLPLERMVEAEVARAPVPPPLPKRRRDRNTTPDPLGPRAGLRRLRKAARRLGKRLGLGR
jgi:hypothetical protein